MIISTKIMTRRNISTMIVAEIVVAAAVAIIGVTEMGVRIVGIGMIKSELIIKIGCSYFVECGWMDGIDKISRVDII